MPPSPKDIVWALLDWCVEDCVCGQAGDTQHELNCPVQLAEAWRDDQPRTDISACCNARAKGGPTGVMCCRCFKTCDIAGEGVFRPDGTIFWTSGGPGGWHRGKVSSDP